MAIDLANIATNKATTTVEYQDQKMKVSYFPNLITAESVEGISKDDKALVQFLCDLISEWDLTAGKTPVPLTPEGLAPVPLPILAKVLRTIMEDASAGEAAAA